MAYNGNFELMSHEDDLSTLLKELSTKEKQT